MTRLTRCLAAGILLSLPAACATVDVKEMALQSAGVAGNSDIDKGATATCPKSRYSLASLLGVRAAAGGPELDAAAAAAAQTVMQDATNPYDDLRGHLPVTLRGTAVIETVIRSAKLSAGHAAKEAFEAQNLAVLQTPSAQAIDGKMAAYLRDNLPQPDSVSTKDFRTFADEFSEKLMRRTKPQTNGTDESFWELVQAYYSVYAEGKFVDYFGTQYAKPTLSLTVTDAELANVVGVFLELTFDAAAKTPVWVPPADAGHTGDTTAGSKQLVQLKNGSGADEDVSKIGWQVGMSIKDAGGAIPAGTTISAIDATAAHPGLSLTLSNAATKATTATHLTVAEAKQTYYPGASTNEPSTLALTGRAATPMASLDPKSVGCGMTILKAKAINTLAQGFGSAASNASGAAVGTIGGVGFSLGVFGKVSIGDNKAVTSLIEAATSELVKRLTVETTYPVLESVAFNAPPHDSVYHLTSPFVTPNPKTPLHHTWLP
jgi:hypothetical protein